MATLTSNYSFDMRYIDLNYVNRNYFASYFYNNIYKVVGSKTYEDQIDLFYDGGSGVVSFLGSGFQFNNYGDVTGGTVQMIFQYKPGYVDFTISGISVSATAIYQAMLTSSTTDEFNIIAAALSGSDTFHLSAYADFVYGFSGNDVIYGYGGNDSLYGNDGNETISGGAGYDNLIGEAGNDTYVTDGLDTITEGASAGTDLVQSSATATLGLNVENLTLTGSVAINGTGNTLNNVLTGNSAANKLNDGTGKDLLLGGSGNDTFIFNAVAESATTATTSDVISDFVRGKDKINLGTIDAFASSGANDTFVWKGTAAFSSTTQGEVRYLKFDNSGTTNDYTMVWIDNDADTGVEMAIRLTGLYTLSASDFIL